MNVKEIQLRENYSYEPNPGMLTGYVKLGVGGGEIKINISEKQAVGLVKLLAELMLETTREVAQAMTLEILEQPLLGSSK